MVVVDGGCDGCRYRLSLVHAEDDDVEDDNGGGYVDFVQSDTSLGVWFNFRDGYFISCSGQAGWVKLVKLPSWISFGSQRNKWFDLVSGSVRFQLRVRVRRSRVKVLVSGCQLEF
ncbi:hypothetical protein Hanom_Chr13g01197791 [Helianthus anomalus]